MRDPEPIQPIIIVAPVRPIVPTAQPRKSESELDDNPKPTMPIPIVRRPTPVPSAPVRLKPAQNAPNNSERIPEEPINNSESIPKEFQIIPKPAQNAPALNMPEVEEEGDVGRKRKNEDTGIYGDISIKDVVLFRYIKKRHFPDLSQDMRDWYEHFYFKAPVAGESPYRGRDYEQHKRAYERGQRWIAEHDARDASTEAVGHSGATIVPFPKRANG